MPSLKFYAGVACALLIACGSEPRRPKLPDTFSVFPNLPLPPDAKFVSRQGSADALQISLFSAGQVEQVAAYYRDMLGKAPWRLVSDVKRPDGSAVLYAEQNGPPIWVRIYPTSDRAGTMVELSGAISAHRKDSVKTDHSGAAPAPKKDK